MPTDWVYPINDRRTDFWDEDETARDFFAHIETEGASKWGLAAKRNMAAGDNIWVRASLPLGAFVGLGVLATPPKHGRRRISIEIDWDVETCHVLAKAPARIQMSSVAQAPRRLTDAELDQLLNTPRLKPLATGKLRRLREVAVRQGQGPFRDLLIAAYEGRCAVTGCSAEQALQAAHIEPYLGPATSVVTNGLLLRSDIHNLFDSGLLWISEAGRVQVADVVSDPAYRALHGRALSTPRRQHDRPDPVRLGSHREQSRVKTPSSR